MARTRSYVLYRRARTRTNIFDGLARALYRRARACSYIFYR